VETTGERPAGGITRPCVACAQGIDLAVEQVLLCEACLVERHVRCAGPACPSCGGEGTLGPIGPAARATGPTIIGKSPRARVRKDRVAYALVFVLSAVMAYARGREEPTIKAVEDPYAAAITQSIVDSPTLGIREDWLSLTWSRLQAGDVRGALDAGDRAVESQPTRADAHTARGAARWQSGDPEGAIQDMTRAVELRGTSVDFSNRGFLRALVGDAINAFGDTAHAVTLDPTNAYAWNNRGLARLLLGDVVSAEEDVRRSLELDPTNPYAWWNLGRVEEVKGHLDLARGHYQRALDEGERTPFDG
jgi:Flp pilus assembly protein TadD